MKILEPNPESLSGAGYQPRHLLSGAMGGTRSAPDIGSHFPSLMPGLTRLLDVVAITGAGLLMYAIYLANDPSALPFESYVVIIVLGATIAHLAFRSSGLYEPEAWRLNAARGASIFRGWFLTAGALLLLGVGSHSIESISRVWITGWCVSAFVLILVLRGGLALMINRRAIVRPTRIAIFGTGENASRLAAALQECGPVAQIVGIFEDAQPSTGDPAESPGDSARDSVDALIKACRNDEVDDVLIALPWSQEQRIYDLYLRLGMVPVNLRLAPDLVGFAFAGNDHVHYGSVSALNLSNRPLAGWDRVLKVSEDKLLSGLVLLFCLPVLLMIAVAIRLESPGPVLFRQVRRGYNSRNFEILKFRTLRHDNVDPEGAIDVTTDDPRVTRVGALLRRLNLDELPQFINVLRGDMSIVGPRPHSLGARAGSTLYEHVAEEYAARHRVKPGITGWAQVNGLRGETDTEEKFRKRVEADLYYIENWSIWLDIEILVRTLLVTASGR